MMRKDDPGFKKLVDAALAKAMTSGEAEAIYKKWFTSPSRPRA
jgi:glutamate/aspartate transport system substrate-binding protein